MGAELAVPVKPELVVTQNSFHVCFHFLATNRGDGLSGEMEPFNGRKRNRNSLPLCNNIKNQLSVVVTLTSRPSDFYGLILIHGCVEKSGIPIPIISLPKCNL